MTDGVGNMVAGAVSRSKSDTILSTLVVSLYIE